MEEPPWISSTPVFLVEEVCEGGQIGFVPTYGNTLMGLARDTTQLVLKMITLLPIMHLNQGQCLRVINSETNQPVDYDTWGRG